MYIIYCNYCELLLYFLAPGVVVYINPLTPAMAMALPAASGQALRRHPWTNSENCIACVGISVNNIEQLLIKQQHIWITIITIITVIP